MTLFVTVTAAVAGRLGSTFLTPWIVPPVGAEFPEKVLFVMVTDKPLTAPPRTSALLQEKVLFATVTK